MKKILGLLTVGVVAGAIVYVYINDNKVKKTKDISSDTTKIEPVDTKIKSSNPITNQNSNDNLNDNLDICKNSTIETISDRHNEAAEVMKDSVEIIYKRSEVSNEEKDELDKISDELDTLLSED